MVVGGAGVGLGEGAVDWASTLDARRQKNNANNFNDFTLDPFFLALEGIVPCHQNH